MNNNSNTKRNRVYSFDELPVVLSVPDLADVLGVSKSCAYQLTHIKDFPTILIGRRRLISRDRLKIWLESQLDSGIIEDIISSSVFSGPGVASIATVASSSYPSGSTIGIAFAKPMHEST